MSQTREQRIRRLAFRAGYKCPEDLKAAIKESRKAMRALETKQFNLPVPVLAEPQLKKQEMLPEMAAFSSGEAREKQTNNERDSVHDSRGWQKHFAAGNGAQREPATLGFVAVVHRQRKGLSRFMQQPAAASSCP